MDSKNEMLDNYLFSKEDQLIPKMEPINDDFIKKERIEEEKCFVVAGIVESLKVDKDSVKKEEIDNCSSSNV